MNKLAIIFLLLCSMSVFATCGGKTSEQKPSQGTPGKTEEAESPEEDATPMVKEGGGDITGAVKFVGSIPKRSKVRANKDQFCINALKDATGDELIVSSDGGIKNVVVTIEGIKGEFVPSGRNPMIDQVNCRYSPHVMAVLAGTSADIHTSDPVNHNVRSYAVLNETINWAMPFQDMTLQYELVEPEVIKISCDVHSWMNGYIVVVGNPFFAVTGDNGSFDIENIPSGTHTVKAWHESLGTAEKEVTIEADGTAEISFEFSSGAS